MSRKKNVNRELELEKLLFLASKILLPPILGVESRKRKRSYQTPFLPILESWERKLQESLLERVIKLWIICSIQVAVACCSIHLS